MLRGRVVSAMATHSKIFVISQCYFEHDDQLKVLFDEKVTVEPSLIPSTHRPGQDRDREQTLRDVFRNRSKALPIVLSGFPFSRAAVQTFQLPVEAYVAESSKKARSFGLDSDLDVPLNFFTSESSNRLYVTFIVKVSNAVDAEDEKDASMPDVVIKTEIDSSLMVKISMGAGGYTSSKNSDGDQDVIDITEEHEGPAVATTSLQGSITSPVDVATLPKFSNVSLCNPVASTSGNIATKKTMIRLRSSSDSSDASEDAAIQFSLRHVARRCSGIKLPCKRGPGRPPKALSSVLKKKKSQTRVSVSSWRSSTSGVDSEEFFNRQNLSHNFTLSPLKKPPCPCARKMCGAPPRDYDYAKKHASQRVNSCESPVSRELSEESTIAARKWLSETMPKLSPYFPQKGDVVYYFLQGHKRYVGCVSVMDGCPFVVKNQNNLPWNRQVLGLGVSEVVKVVQIVYTIEKPSLVPVAELTVERCGRGVQARCKTFKIRFHECEGEEDFLILRQFVDRSSRDWEIDQRVRSIFHEHVGMEWSNGTIKSIGPAENDHPDSPFHSIKVSFDRNGQGNLKVEPLSPWDLSPLDDTTDEPEDEILVTAEELKALAYEPEDADWPECGYESIKERGLDILQELMDEDIASDFLEPVDAAQHAGYLNTVAYPVDLGMIKARLENNFYRHLAALEFDVGQIVANADKYYGEKHRVAQGARVVASAFLELIRSDSYDGYPGSVYPLVWKHRNNMKVDLSSAGMQVRQNTMITEEDAERSIPNDADGKTLRKRRRRKQTVNGRYSKRIKTKRTTEETAPWKYNDETGRCSTDELY